MMTFRNTPGQIRAHYNAKTTTNNLEALEYLIDGVPLDEESYHHFYVEPALRYLELEKQHRVLDVGCGFGGILRHVEQHADHCVGIDLSDALLRRFKGHSPVMLGEAVNPPFRANSFDRVYMVSVAIFFPGFDYFCRVARRLFDLLKDDGILLIGDQSFGPQFDQANYLRIRRVELVEFLNTFGQPYSIVAQAKRKRAFSDRYDIIVYKERTARAQ